MGEVLDELSGSDDQMVEDPDRPLTPAENEQLILDQLTIPKAPLDEAQRRAQWRALPTRTRIAIRRLHRQFGHPTPATLKNILKAGRAPPELIEAARLVRCQASQWVLGKQLRMPGSVTDMSESADLGVIEAKADPNVAYHKAHATRMSAQRAFVHLDTSNRVARALTRNAAPQHKEYAVGDLVCDRRDAQQGGTTWSTASRVIGHDPHNG